MKVTHKEDKTSVKFSDLKIGSYFRHLNGRDIYQKLSDSRCIGESYDPCNESLHTTLPNSDCIPVKCELIVLD